MRKGFTQKIFKKLTLIIVSFTIALVLAEIALRIFYPSTRNTSRPAEPDYSYELISTDGTLLTKPGSLKFVMDPYLQHRNAPNQHNHLYNINSLGFRGREIAREKAAGIFRIIVLGGSGAFGMSASSDDTTIPAFLERSLNDAGRKTEVINAGVIAYISGQDLAYLETELIDLNPDLVIAYNGFNDFFASATITQGCRAPLEHSGWIRFPGYFYEIESMLLDRVDERNAGAFYGLALWSRNQFLRSAIGGLIRSRTSMAKDRPMRNNRPDYNLPKVESQNWKDYRVDPGCVDLIANTYRRNLEQMARFLGAYNVPLLIAVQPEKTWKREWWTEAEAKAAAGVLQSLPWYDRSLEFIYPKLINAGLEVSQKFNLPEIDLHSVFRDRKEEIFVDPVHLHDFGNRIVAEAITARIISFLKVQNR